MRWPNAADAADSWDLMSFSLYIAKCADGSLYTGIATDVQRRILEHNGVKGGKAKGARYTSARRPVTLVYEAAFATRSDASKEEARIKRLTRLQKELLISGSTNAKAQRNG